MIDYKEYTKQRDIAVKRIKRLQAKGWSIEYLPQTVKTLRANPAIAEMEFMRLNAFLTEGPSLARKQEARRTQLTPEDKRRRQRYYRRRKVAREIEKMLPAKMAGKYQAYVKGLQKLKIDIPPSKLPEFFAYMDYRFAQGRDDQKYLFDIFSNDYIEMLAEGYKPEDIVSDFEQFAVDQAEIMNRKDLMDGIDAETAINLWNKFKNI